MNIVVSQNAVDGITSFVSYMRRLGFSRQALMKYKNQMLSFVSQCIQGAVTKRQLKNNSGSCYFRIPNRKEVWVFGFVYYPNNQTVLITGMGLRQGIDEGKRLDEFFIHPLTKPFRLGEWECVDGSEWYTVVKGFEDKGVLLDKCSYFTGEVAIHLYQRCDNEKYFYAKIYNKPDSHWMAISRKEVPDIILSDFRHCLQRLEERKERAIASIQ